MSDSAGSLPPEQAKEQKIRMLHKFYQTTTLEELVFAQDHQIEKLQGKIEAVTRFANASLFPSNPRQG